MGNRIAVLTNESHSGYNIRGYCNTVGIPYEDCVDCAKNYNFFNEVFYYEAGGKLLSKHKNTVPYYVSYLSQDVSSNIEWYVYGSASEGRVATVYPRFKIQDNELYDNNFEDSPPNPAVAYNTEMVSNTFTDIAKSASITGIETHRHLGEKRYEIKDHLGNVRAVVSDIKNAVDSSFKIIISNLRFVRDWWVGYCY